MTERFKRHCYYKNCSFYNCKSRDKCFQSLHPWRWNTWIKVPHFSNKWSSGGSDSRVCLQCGRPRFNSCIGKMPLGKEMATHSSILAWKIPWTEEPVRLQSMGLQRVRHNWVTPLCFPFSQYLCIYKIKKTPHSAHEEIYLSIPFYFINLKVSKIKINIWSLSKAVNIFAGP